jgi:hypothetical protein
MRRVFPQARTPERLAGAESHSGLTSATWLAPAVPFGREEPVRVLQPWAERDDLPGGRGAYGCLTARFLQLARPPGFGPVALFHVGVGSAGPLWNLEDADSLASFHHSEFAQDGGGCLDLSLRTLVLIRQRGDARQLLTWLEDTVGEGDALAVRRRRREWEVQPAACAELAGRVCRQWTIAAELRHSPELWTFEAIDRGSGVMAGALTLGPPGRHSRA